MRRGSTAEGAIQCQLIKEPHYRLIALDDVGHGPGLEGLQSFFELCIRLRGDQPFIPRGVYRFKSHEDLDQWTLKMLTRPRVAHPQ